MRAILKRGLLLFVSLALMMIGFTSCLFQNDLEEFFTDWQSASGSNVAYVIYDDRIEMNGEARDLSSVLCEYYDMSRESGYFQQGFCVYNNTFYGLREFYYPVYDTEEQIDRSRLYNSRIDLFSVDLDTMDLRVIYSDDFFLRANGLYKSFEPWKNAYYQDGKILLCDEMKTVMYDVASDTVEEHPASFFADFEKMYTVSYQSDAKGYLLLAQEEQRLITLEYLTNRNNNLQEVRDADIPCRLAKAYVIDDVVYFVCEVQDRDGDITAVFFQYDFIEDTVVYLYRYFTSDVVSDDIYPICWLK